MTKLYFNLCWALLANAPLLYVFTAYDDSTESWVNVFVAKNLNTTVYAVNVISITFDTPLPTALPIIRPIPQPSLSATIYPTTHPIAPTPIPLPTEPARSRPSLHPRQPRAPVPSVESIDGWDIALMILHVTSLTHLWTNEISCNTQHVTVHLLLIFLVISA